ncbi:hypothetical protein SDC9_202919 [bioreactor metagenome]|uniref:Uncharacterized protein n=1 Tax=bioreactor metagenome TaxID=1076179 RepID=A0A645IXT4_9ZZZZ
MIFYADYSEKHDEKKDHQPEQVAGEYVHQTVHIRRSFPFVGLYYKYIIVYFLLRLNAQVVNNFKILRRGNTERAFKNHVLT